MLICQFCSKNSKNHNAHRNHERCCPSNPDRNYKNNKIGKKGGNQFSYAQKHNLSPPEAWNKGKPGNFKGKKHSEESKRKISAALSINNKGGRCTWFEVQGQKVQGAWEKAFALKMSECKITWIKLKTNRDTFSYKWDNELKHYTPDFYLPDFDRYIEIKGHWWGKDKEKMSLVLEQCPLLRNKLLIIEKDLYNEIINADVADVVLALS